MTFHRMKISTHRPALLAALTLLFLSACANVPPPQVTPLTVPAANPAVTLIFWHTETGTAATTLAALADDFHKAYPSLTVRGEQKSNEGDLLRQGIAAIALNRTPDFIIADPRTIAEFARKDALLNLDAFAADPAQALSDAERNDYLPGLLDAGRLPDLNNQWFAFPFDQSAVVLYYNSDLLKAAKADVPPRTWDQFDRAARATTKGNARGWAMSPRAAVFSAFLFSRGGAVLTTRANQTQARLGDDAGLNTLLLIAQLSKGGSAYLVDHIDTARSDFAQGKTTFLFDTTDHLAALANAIARAGNFQWGVTNIPQNDPAKPATVVCGEDLAIFKPGLSGAGGEANERLRATWLFARWLTLPEQSARWSQATSALPVRVSALGLLAKNLPPNFQRLRDGFNILPTAFSMPAVKDASLIDSAIVELWTNVANGADPAVALKSAVPRVNRILGQTP